MFEGVPPELAFQIRRVVDGEPDLPNNPDDVMALKEVARRLLGQVQGEVESIQTYSASTASTVRNLVVTAVQRKIRERAEKCRQRGATEEQSPENSDARVLATDNILRVFGTIGLQGLDDSSIDQWLKNQTASVILAALRKRHGTNSAAMKVIREIVARNASLVKMPSRQKLEEWRSEKVALAALAQLIGVRKFNPERKEHRIKFAKWITEETCLVRNRAFFQHIMVRVKNREISFDNILVVHGWKINSRREGFESLCSAAGFSYEQALKEAAEVRASVRDSKRRKSGDQGRETSKEKAARVGEAALKPSIVAPALSDLFGSKIRLSPRDPRWRGLYAKIKNVKGFTVTNLEKERVTIPGLPTRQWLVIFQSWSGKGQGSAWGFYRILTEVCGIPPKDIQKLKWRTGHHKDPDIIREALRQAFGLLDNINWNDQRTKAELRTLFCKERPEAISREIFLKPITPSPMLLSINLGHMSQVHSQCDQPRKHQRFDIEGYLKMLEIVGI